MAPACPSKSKLDPIRLRRGGKLLAILFSVTGLGLNLLAGDRGARQGNVHRRWMSPRCGAFVTMVTASSKTRPSRAVGDQRPNLAVLLKRAMAMDSDVDIDEEVGVLEVEFEEDGALVEAIPESDEAPETFEVGDTVEVEDQGFIALAKVLKVNENGTYDVDIYGEDVQFAVDAAILTKSVKREWDQQAELATADDLMELKPEVLDSMHDGVVMRFFDDRRKAVVLVDNVTNDGQAVSGFLSTSGLVRREGEAEVERVGERIRLGQKIQVRLSLVVPEKYGAPIITMTMRADEERVPVADVLDEQAKDPLEFQLGEKCQGIVTAILEFGVFVAIGAQGINALVPLGFISSHLGKIVTRADLCRIFTVGQIIPVWVKDVTKSNTGRARITAVLSKAQPVASAEANEELYAALSSFWSHSRNAFVEGKVVRIKDNSKTASVVFELPDGTTTHGWLHAGQIKEGGFVHRVSRTLSIGQQVRVRLLSVQRYQTGKPSVWLTMKRPFHERKASDPEYQAKKQDVRPFVKLQGGTWLSGRVRGVYDFGAFVEIWHPQTGNKVRGLLPRSQIADEYVSSTADFMQYGDSVEVWISDVDVEAARLTFSMLE